MKGVTDEACKLLFDRFMAVEKKDALAEVVELLQVGAMRLRLSRMPAHLIGESTHHQRDTFEGHERYPIMGIRHVQQEERFGKKVVQASDRYQGNNACFKKAPP